MYQPPEESVFPNLISHSKYPPSSPTIDPGTPSPPLQCFLDIGNSLHGVFHEFSSAISWPPGSATGLAGTILSCLVPAINLEKILNYLSVHNCLNGKNRLGSFPLAVASSWLQTHILSLIDSLKHATADSSFQNSQFLLLIHLQVSWILLA